MLLRIGAVLLLALLLASFALCPRPAAANAVPSIDAEITVPGWWVVGPFLAGVREAGVDPLYFAEGAPDFETPLLRPSFPSVLVPGGEARWRYYASDADGALSVDYPEVPEASMKLVTDEWGGSGANTVGYAYAKLHIDGGPMRALLDLRGAGMLSINGVPWPGDPYSNGMGQSPVLLPDGDLELKVAIGASQRFSLKFLPVQEDLVAFTQSATLPDLVRGEKLPHYFGIPLANTTMDWIKLSGFSMQSEAVIKFWDKLDVSIPPLCVYNLSILLRGITAVPAELDDLLEVRLSLEYSPGGKLEVPLSLNVRDPQAPRKVTFLSAMDNSVQYYGLLPPSNFDPQREYGLILSLHGAGVEAIGQVASYRPKDWAYVVAPTNRRPYGFDWQDWGQRDMLEVLFDVERNCNIDENRVHLTGHSMGGHGTWLNALTFPGLWASAAPSAGWTRFDLYAPMFLRRNLLYGEPKANYIWQLAMRGDDTLALCENALNLPIYALQGGADDNVPPQQPRLLVERLRQLGYDITYKELPGMGHWWDDPATEGIDCVDSAELNAFWESHVRDPWPKEVVYRSGGAQFYRGAYWITAKPERLGDDTSIHAKVNDGTINIDTTNADWLQLRLAADWSSAGGLQLRIDGDLIKLSQAELPNPSAPIYFYKLSGPWSYISPKYTEGFDWVAGSYPRGFKSVLMQPCRVVIPTGGMEEENEWCLQLARLYAYNWWYRGNGALSVMTDTQALTDPGWRGNYICLACQSSNQLLDAISIDTELLWSVEGKLFLDENLEHQIAGEDLAMKWITPYTSESSSGLCLIEGGTSLKAMKRLPAMMGLYSGAGFPDWMVWDDEVKLKGMGGVLGMGFFDLDWQVDPDLSYFNEELIARRAAGN